MWEAHVGVAENSSHTDLSTPWTNIRSGCSPGVVCLATMTMTLGNMLYPRRKKRESNDQQETVNTDNSIDKDHPSPKMLTRSKSRFCIAVLMLVAVLSVLMLNSGNVNHNDESKTVKVVQMRKVPDFDKFQNCSVSTTLAARDYENTKPFWIPSFPNSVDDAVLRSWLTDLTGIQGACKSYYAQNNRFKKCRGDGVVTVACTQIHPTVSIGPDPSAQTATFQHEIFYAIRHPLTAIPSFMNFKAIKYHHHIGQVALDDWRRSRDAFWQTSVQTWMESIDTWLNLPYKVGMYIAYEHVMDVERGPVLVERIANKLREAGYETALEQDYKCIWYHGVGGRSALEQHYRMGYEYTDFVPAYTNKQCEFLLARLRSAIGQYNNDENKELVALLQEYVEITQTYDCHDHEWENKTTSRS